VFALTDRRRLHLKRSRKCSARRASPDEALTELAETCVNQEAENKAALGARSPTDCIVLFLDQFCMSSKMRVIWSTMLTRQQSLGPWSRSQADKSNAVVGA
jgi:hypothetical protein